MTDSINETGLGKIKRDHSNPIDTSAIKINTNNLPTVEEPQTEIQKLREIVKQQESKIIKLRQQRNDAIERARQLEMLVDPTNEALLRDEFLKRLEDEKRKRREKEIINDTPTGQQNVASQSESKDQNKELKSFKFDQETIVIGRAPEPGEKIHNDFIPPDVLVNFRNHVTPHISKNHAKITVSGAFGMKIYDTSSNHLTAIIHPDGKEEQVVSSNGIGHTKLVNGDIIKIGGDEPILIKVTKEPLSTKISLTPIQFSNHIESVTANNKTITAKELLERKQNEIAQSV